MTQQTDRELLQEIHRAWVMASDTGGVIHHLSGPMARARTALAHPEPEGDGLFHWRNLGDGKPVQVRECPMCGIAPANVDDCGRFGDPACPYFGVGEPEPERPTASDVTELFYRHMGEGSEVGFENAIAEALTRFARPAIRPVPATEPVPVEDCDGDGNCWWFCPAAILPNGQCAYWCLAPADGARSWFTHWLPARAMPIPSTH